MKLDDIDLTDLRPFEQGFPHDVFALLRREAPVWWHRPTASTPDGEGFWVVSTHARLLEVVRDGKRFSSESGPGRAGRGGTLIEDLPPPLVGTMINMTDEPRHTRIRRLVSHAFAPRSIARLEAPMRARVVQLCDGIRAQGGCDFLRDVARELPLQVIAEMLGIPQEDRHALFEWVSVALDYRERDLGESSDTLTRAAAALWRYADRKIAEKRARPADDLLSFVIHASVEGEDGSTQSLSADELQSFFTLLFAAGSDTTRNAIAGGLLALIEHPEQLEALRREPAILPSAIEEILRWTSPVLYNRRTATCDTELGGQTIRGGEKVTHWYPSANRDEEVFDDPFRFDLRREPNLHVAFGQGLHFCLGAELARREIAVTLEALLGRFTDFALAGDVVYSRSNKHSGMLHMPITFRCL